MIQAAPQIVHESETQRQYVRLRMPSMVEMDGQSFSVRDLSSGGLAIRGIERPLKKGERLTFKLVLPFERFAMDVTLTAEVQHYDKKLQTAGCRFVDLDAAQISILNHIVRAYIGGDIVDSSDILQVVAKNGFVNVRRADVPPEQDTKDKIKSMAAYAGLGVLALTLTGIIATNIGRSIFTLSTPHGVVAGDTFTVAAPTAGIFTSGVADGTSRVAKNSTLGTLTPAGSAGGYTIKSPCDCFIATRALPSGQYAAQGAAIFTLLPQQGATHISALIPAQDAHKIRIGASAAMIVAGGRERFTGTVTDIRNSDKTIPGAPGTAPLPAAIITITPDDGPVKADLIGRPVMVEVRR